MRKNYDIGSFFGMRVRAKPTAAVMSLGLFIVLVIIGAALFDASLVAVIAAAAGIVILHNFLEVYHQYGHYIAGKKVGYPLSYIIVWGLLGVSIYPKDEPELPAEIHIRRALGGPLYSFYFSLITGIPALALYLAGTELFWIPLFACAHNLAIFTLGAFVPLHVIGIETDGTTLLKWWGKRGQAP